MRYSTWFVFTIYVVISCALLFSNNAYQQSVYLTSANGVTSVINSTTNDIRGYFDLRSINEELMASNAALENEVLNLRSLLDEYEALLSDSTKIENQNRFDYVMASVIGNSTRHPHNYISINRGSADGVESGMGVVDHNGIVGIVNVTAPHTARIISVLNNAQRFSVKLKGTEFAGNLIWKGQDPHIAYVENIPRHAVYHIGDTVVTSGFSHTFPEGINVGTVLGQVRAENNNYFTLKVKLATNFGTLNTVRVIKDSQKAILDSLANFDAKDDE